MKDDGRAVARETNVALDSRAERDCGSKAAKAVFRYVWTVQPAMGEAPRTRVERFRI